ncbi:MAG TPA: response regulator, partial [Rubrobacteraceae bacterium]|nr:response regulator [Rubrobacteraceae bacterium]
MKHIFLLEEQACFRQALARALEREPDLEVIGQAGSLAEARNGVPGRWRAADVAIIGLLLPDGVGTDLIEDLREVNPNLPVLVLTVLDSTEFRAWAIRMGANELLGKKSASISEVIAEIRRLVGEKRLVGRTG